jgi:Tfp pilus assembly protein PilN
MKKVLIWVGVVVGLVAVFEVGLLFFPWTYWPHLVSRPLTLAEKNQRLWERFAPVPLWETEATPSQDTEGEALIDRVQELEARLADLEKQGASQNSATSPGPVSYTDQELLESRDQGPN